MKKRALILAMIAFIAATTSEPSINMVRAEETQVEETQTEENAGQTSELPIKTLTPKVIDENPYMAASDSNIHHDCYNTDSTDEVLPVDIYSEINVSYEKVNPNASPAVFFDSYGHAVVPLLGGLAIRDINAEETQTLGYFSPKQHDNGDYLIQSSYSFVDESNRLVCPTNNNHVLMLKATDEDGNVIDEWVSTEKAHVIKELTVGKSYTMTETKPADGYVTAESITFTVENTAEIQKQEMKDDVTKVLISKQDIAGKELSGAKLTILDEEGNVIESWTSTEEAHYIEMLPIGTYTLREETAPEGYLIAKDVVFEVKDTAEVQKVVMVDEEKPKESTPEGGKPSKDAPKTGDNSNLLLWLIVLGMSLSGVVVLGRKIKKK